MTYRSAAQADAPVHVDDARPLRTHLYKTDRPRDIDRVIDFFGDHTARAEADADPCGEVVLESA
jgi:hypothetical protein